MNEGVWETSNKKKKKKTDIVLLVYIQLQLGSWESVLVHPWHRTDYSSHIASQTSGYYIDGQGVDGGRADL